MWRMRKWLTRFVLAWVMVLVGGYMLAVAFARVTAQVHVGQEQNHRKLGQAGSAQSASADAEQAKQTQRPAHTQESIQVHAQKLAQYAIINDKPLGEGVRADYVFVDKSERRMDLLADGRVLRRYHIALGASPKGHKNQEGDERTPEGVYTLDYKKEDSIAHRSIHISYPNAADQAAAKKRGVSAGGFIMIHGQMNGYGYLAPAMQLRDWTDGCIAVTNSEMDEVMDLVPVGTRIEIVW